jgi:ribonuclease HI
MTINVYTDGSCIHNGQPNALAGYGVYFSENDSRNESKKVIGKQSNNTGELTGVIRAMEILEENLKNSEKIAIYTDSEYVIKCLSSYGDKLKKNDWKTSTDKKPPNVELVKKAYGFYNTYKKFIKLNHVDAHTNNTDEHSIGNKGADLLANLAIGQTSCPYNNSSERDEKVYIDIPFSHKDIAKETGALWDIKKKSWYYKMSLDAQKRDQLDTLSKNTQSDKKHKDIASFFSKKDETLFDIDEDPTESLYEEIRKHREDSMNTSSLPNITSIGAKKFESNTSIDSKDKIYIKIPFAKKDQAKGYGARWEPSVKSWYYLPTLKQSNIDKLLELSK